VDTVEADKNWPRRSVRALGVLILLLGVPNLVYCISILTHNEKLRTAMAEVGPGYVSIELLGSYDAGTIAGLLMGFAFFAAVGVGLWKLKFWGRLGGEALAVVVVTEIYREIWFYGPRVHGWLYNVLWMLFVGLTLILLNDSAVRAQFPLPRKARNVTRRREFLFLTIPILIGLLAFPANMVYLRIKHRDDIAWFTAVPEKVKYVVRDSSFLADSCYEYRIFGYSVCLPKNLTVNTAGKNDYSLGWWLMLVSSDTVPFDFLVTLEDRSRLEQHSGLEQTVLGFRSFYEFERTLMYPTWSPVYFYLRPLLIADWAEHATGSGWKGFVTGYHLEDKKRYNIEASLYDEDEGRSGCVRMNFRDDYMSLGQVKELLASLRFGGEKEPCSQLFSRGEEMMLKGEYAQATALFLTAFRGDTLNADYAFHVARSLLEDRRPFRRKTHLRSAVEFLRCVLELDPKHAEARELLSASEEELERLEGEKTAK
jgi:hypothetical protein